MSASVERNGPGDGNDTEIIGSIYIHDRLGRILSGVGYLPVEEKDAKWLRIQDENGVWQSYRISDISNITQGPNAGDRVAGKPTTFITMRYGETHTLRYSFGDIHDLIVGESSVSPSGRRIDS